MGSLEAQLAGLRQELAAVSQRQAAVAKEIHLWREKMVALCSDEVHKIMQQALKLYSEDHIELVDYALESSGASILSSQSLETYGTRMSVISLFGITLWYHFQIQRAIHQVGLNRGPPGWLSVCRLLLHLWGLGSQGKGAPGSRSVPCATTFYVICLLPIAKCLPWQVLGISGLPGLHLIAVTLEHVPKALYLISKHHQHSQRLCHLGEYLDLAVLSKTEESPFLTAAFRGEEWKDLPIVQTGHRVSSLDSLGPALLLLPLFLGRSQEKTMTAARTAKIVICLRVGKGRGSPFPTQSSTEKRDGTST
uniref:Uncharacterized protein LOC110203931 isoform X1 n=2 Tax=Phascolarctos cinereus TaxID=38626 RepID=A0A6P5JNX9_PHACI|nr:uncharacterized protein LOC110203931 isoform X1 [Phascolarctos cinereus]XP_020835972.1 uncharacterized protein LOC110203931 isoform X1 [Phascolarctos cinereus]XP_020835974.1 uncharacterized protein LOC110203931 isoform X1 [Phascolarctos cinereus]XP_020835975.1 uncharacterized protein LOC110203931 isoform X1 [Phascolarctos cinereus]XP_020835976.1 uncharacterized protein LOC110203931 isoform X1 [Phascolarctos cinereus]XP_020835977.1 uncharacterized protein LOC110203931 isoform X1 [Phascolarct